jgi:hypothetical protein
VRWTIRQRVWTDGQGRGERGELLETGLAPYVGTE